MDLTTTVSYDQRGLVVSTVDPRGNVTGATAAEFETTASHDAMGRLVNVTGPLITVEEAGSTPANAKPSFTYGYDAAGNEETFVDPRGHRTTSSFDRLNRLTRVEHPPYTPPGGSLMTPYEEFDYDAVGNLIEQRSRRGNVTQYRFDDRNRVVAQIDPYVTGEAASGVWRTEYDDADNRTATIDPTGARVEYEHDDLDRLRTRRELVRQPSPITAETHLDYDDLGNQTYFSDPEGVTTAATFDAASRRHTVEDALNKVISFEFDVAGRPTAVVDPLGRRIEHHFDQAGRETSTVWKAPDGTPLATTYQTYDAAGNVTELRSARSASSSDDTYLTTRVYDAAGRLEQVLQPDSNGSLTTSYGYDANGNLTRITDANLNTTTISYNPWDLQQSLVEPSTTAHPNLADRTWTTSYDAGGLPTAQALPGGVTVNRSFDALGRMTTEIGSGSGTTTAQRSFAYDLTGRRTAIDHPDGDITLTLDDRGLVLESSLPASNVPAAVFDYDDAGRMTSRTDAAGTSTFTYTARGELDVVTEPLTGGTLDHGWNDAGQLASVAYTGGSVRSLTYDGRGQLDTDVVNDSTSTIIAAADYDYDAELNVTSVAYTAPGNPASGSHTYAYDESGRLASWTNPASTAINYTYDGAGNRTAAGALTYQYDERNRLIDAGGTAYSWDPRGTLSQTNDGTSTTSVAFDGLGRLVNFSDATFTFDGLDRIAERDPDGPGSAAPAAFTYAGTELDPVGWHDQRYARTPAGELTAVEVGANSRFAVENRHGDLAALLDTTGVVTNSTIWDPYGNAAGTTGSAGGAVGYQGDWTDPDSGQVWMGARWYDPTTATFTSRDTVFGELSTPVTLNRYTYANGDPLEFFDPDGQFSFSAVGRWVNRNVIEPVKKAANTVKEKVVDPSRKVLRAAAATVTSAAAHATRTVASTAKRTAAKTWSRSKTLASTASRSFDTAKQFVKDNRNTIISIAAAAATYAGCSAATAGFGSSNVCIYAAGAAGGAVSGALENCGNGHSASRCAIGAVAGGAIGAASVWAGSAIAGSSAVASMTGGRALRLAAAGAATSGGGDAGMQLATTRRVDLGRSSRAAGVGAFLGLLGSKVSRSSPDQPTPRSIDPSDIRLSQATINGPKTTEIPASMRANGWKGDAIDVVRMPDGRLTTFDNKRVVAASEAGIPVRARVHNFDDAFPAGRLSGKGGPPATWADAISQRIASQKGAWRNCYPMGAPITCRMGDL